MHVNRDNNGTAVRRLVDAGAKSLIRRRDVRGVVREVFLTPDGHVLKSYTHRRPPPRFRQPWILEFRALHRIAGRGAPSVIGYVTEETEQGFRAVLARRFLPGETIRDLDAGLVSEIAALLAEFHGAGVTTDDPHLRNFVRTPDGGVAFLDFGRARLFSHWNPLLLAGIALDLRRFFRAGLRGDGIVWQEFLKDYLRHCQFGPVRRGMIRGLIALEIWRHGLVRGNGIAAPQDNGP